MLRGIRKASSNWLGRAVMGVVLGLIAVSFAIWGIGDIFRGFGRSTVAKIGSTEITVDQFRQIYNDRLQQLSRQLGRPVTPDQARALRLEQQLAGQLVAEAALDQRARQLRLNVSDAEIARQITNDPSFKGMSGQFDRARFEQIIRGAGYTEQRFTAEQRRLTLRREIAETVGGEMTLPKTMADALNRYENEQRAIDYVVLDRAKAGDIPPPTPEAIAKYFDERKAEFRAPEYRTIVVMSVAPADLARPADVSDADAKRYYDMNLARFGTPERRQVEQISFPTLEEAQAAATRLEKSELSFEALAKERGLTEKDIDLGLVTKAGIIDSAVADAAFALKQDEVSAPVKGMFGTMLVHVVKIEPENIKPFEEVTPEIKQTLATDRARSELASRHDKIEDERAGGMRLAEVAQKLGLKATTFEAIDRQGRNPNGEQVGGLPSGIDVLAAAFRSDMGVENEPLQIAGGGYVWFEVAGAKPSRERTLEEVRARVEEKWQEEQISERLKAKAAGILDKVKAGTSLNDAAAADGLTVQTTFGLKRAGNAGSMPPSVIEAVFATPKDGAGSAVGKDATERVVFHLTDITVPTFDSASPEGKRIEDTTRRALTEDLLAQYVAQLQTDLGATINQDALRRVASGSSSDQN
ncbi:MAG: peptidyl-prolyl cis-trans isomerase [Hyphomicrobiales bacterium]|nr:peptidyl-prolyl cis-trans isomerase [Hyphomicrobiales bacterium]